MKIGRYSKSLSSFLADEMEAKQLFQLAENMEERMLAGNEYCSVQLEDDIFEKSIIWWIEDDPGEETRKATFWVYRKPNEWLIKVIIPELKKRLDDIRLTAENIELILEHKDPA